jgi:hypothetical protein
MPKLQCGNQPALPFPRASSDKHDNAIEKESLAELLVDYG